MRDRLERIFRRFRGRTDYLEIRLEEAEHLSFSLNKEGVETVTRWADVGAAIRACRKGGWGFAALNDMGSLERLALAAVEQARAVGSGETTLAEVEPVEASIRLQSLEDPRKVSLEEKLDILREYNEMMLAHSGTIFNTSTGYDESVSRITFANSDGTYLDKEALDLSFYCLPRARQDGLVQSHVLSDGSSNDFGIVRGRQEEVNQACRQSLALVNAPPVKAGTYPVVVDPELGGTFIHEAFGHWSEADTYLDDPSMHRIMTLGRRFGREILNVYDTGSSVGARGFLAYDDEGVPCRRADLLREGILVGRLHNRETAGRFGEAPTGNARAMSYRFPPICRMRNTAVAAGDARFEDLLEGIELGVYAVGSGGGGGGEMFSFNADHGFMIRRGRLAELVRDVTISGNLFATLERIDCIADDFRTISTAGGCGKGAQSPLPVSESSPSFRITEATVGGAL